MKPFRRWHVLLLLSLMIDLVTPTMPGIFSILHGNLFMDGLTRAPRSPADVTCLRECPRARISAADPLRASALRAADLGARDARRAHEHPDPRRPLYVIASPRAADSEDH
jgi:hypothetical protein